MTAAQLALLAAGVFFLAGLLTGIWKYIGIATSEQARAHYYVDIAHRACLMYAFACLLLERFARISSLADNINFWAVLVSVVFYALAVVSYMLHGLLKDTRNQLRRPHQLGGTTLPNSLMIAFMAALISAEVGGFGVLFVGFLESL